MLQKQWYNQNRKGKGNIPQERAMDSQIERINRGITLWAWALGANVVNLCAVAIICTN